MRAKSQLTLRNNGDLPGNWSIVQGPSWLNATETSGALGPGEIKEIELAADANRSPGTYSDVLVFAFDERQISIGVTLIVSSSTEIDVFPGTGAGGIVFGEPYSKVNNLYGTNFTHQIAISPEIGFVHFLRYKEQGIEFILVTSDGVLKNHIPVQLIEISDPYSGITDRGVGVGSTIQTLLDEYGQPDAIDRQFRRYEYDRLGMRPKYDVSEISIESILLHPPLTSGKTSSIAGELLELVNSQRAK